MSTWGSGEILGQTEIAQIGVFESFQKEIIISIAMLPPEKEQKQVSVNFREFLNNVVPSNTLVGDQFRDKVQTLKSLFSSPYYHLAMPIQIV